MDGDNNTHAMQHVLQLVAVTAGAYYSLYLDKKPCRTSPLSGKAYKVPARASESIVLIKVRLLFSSICASHCCCCTVTVVLVCTARLQVCMYIALALPVAYQNDEKTDELANEEFGFAAQLILQNSPYLPNTLHRLNLLDSHLVLISAKIPQFQSTTFFLPDNQTHPYSKRPDQTPSLGCTLQYCEYHDIAG
jgi:hypothetical protein